ncbi:MAG: hypothetical protein LBQ22_01935 [Bacteroidales bacterium]|jgi:hypothetical protein|nr:hypothetical protein [Bacteroidales bacterium]
MESIFLSIKEHLKTELPSGIYVEKNCGQLTNENENFPCCLIDIKKIKYVHLSDGIQQANAKISICVADTKPQDTNPQNDKSFGIYGLIEDVDKALQKLNSVNFSRFCRTKLKKKFANGIYECYELLYNINFVINEKSYDVWDMDDCLISKDEPVLTNQESE